VALSNRCDKYTFGADKKGRCMGTRERDVCNCQGDRTLCDFYPEVREKAIKEYECGKISALFCIYTKISLSL
jgi:hypothetical protein